jgi:shikimate dehydrogenase
MKRYGLIGYPVKHSLSPAMHNAAFRHLKIDAEYSLFEVKPDGLDEFFAKFKEDLSGINVTIPHKESVFKYVDKVEGDAERIGAINTIALKDGKLIGHNTDVTGFTGALIEDLRLDPKVSHVTLMGAGGASRAVVFGLLSLGVTNIYLTDIDADKALSLANDVNKRGGKAVAVQHDKKALGELVANSQLFVNATPCGMKPGDPELLDPRFLHKKLAVFDLIYNPAETPLIAEAGKRGLKAANGLSMLLFQGAEAFELWTGENAPVQVMYEALCKALNIT